MNTYEECISFLYSQLPMFQRKGLSAYKKDLSNISRLCEALGNPQEKLHCIHVAGTNGKGSVSHIIAGTLLAEGYRVGLYTSPHYLDFRERIKIGKNLIPKKSVIEFTKWYQSSSLGLHASFLK